MIFTIKTIGCKVNTYESNKIKAELQKAGLIFIDVDKKEEYKNLDYYIINTCSVTSIADKKSRQMIHSAKAANKNLKVVATGCYVDAHKDNLDKDIDIFVLNADKMTLASKILEDIKKRNAKDANAEKLQGKVSLSNENVSGEKKNNLHVREFIKIQDGCNQYCTYCIIPFLRGNIKSREDHEIIEEIKEKVKAGTKEIVLTGIHISSFGVDRVEKSYESEGAIDIARKALLKLIVDISSIKIKKSDMVSFNDVETLEVERIRLGSLEPRLINDDFIKSLMIGSAKDKFCGSFCLSLQSGCDKTLKAMNRHYTTKDFELACDTIRKYLPYATITADVIVGFPGESEEDFMESLSFVKKMRFYNPNIFPYSRRPGTKADLMDGQLTKEEKHKRAIKMIEECDKITKEIYDTCEFEKHPILIEEEIISSDGTVKKSGYTKEYLYHSIFLQNSSF